MAQCKAIRKDGGRCQAQATSDGDYCFFHDEARKAEARSAQVRGGQQRTRSVLDPAALTQWRQPGTVPSPDDVLLLLADTIDEVKTGQLDPKVANSVGYLVGVMLKALEYDALNERLAALEAAVGV